MPEAKWSAGSWVIGGHRDRFVDYHDSPAFETKLRRLAEDKRIKGVEVICPYEDIDAPAIREVLKELDLEVVAVLASGMNDFAFKTGGISSSIESVRHRAQEQIRAAAETALALGCSMVNIWPGQDGYDYAFQSDYWATWKAMRASIMEAATAYPSLKFALEYKPYEPRAASALPSVYSALLLCEDIGLDNVGITLDFGHALLAHESPAEAATIAMGYGRLMHVHLNDNRGRFDDDFMPATAHIVETLELFWHLQRAGYDGWLSLDISPAREVPEDAVRWSLDALEALYEKAQRLDRATLEPAMERGDSIACWDQILKQLLK
ncbi:MAG: sugar phosphate isomerase/epimerase family protein [Bacteroidota bacterium]